MRWAASCAVAALLVLTGTPVHAAPSSTPHEVSSTWATEVPDPSPSPSATDAPAPSAAATATLDPTQWEDLHTLVLALLVPLVIGVLLLSVIAVRLLTR